MTEELGEIAGGILAGLSEAIAHAQGDQQNVQTTFYKFADAKMIREQIGMSQSEFCSTYGIPLKTLQNWEQRRNNPDRTASAYLWAIAELPVQISEAQIRHRNGALSEIGAQAF